MATKQDDKDAAADQSASPEEGAGGRWPVDRLKPVLEAVLFASGDPLAVSKICELIEGVVSSEVRATLKELETDCLTRGIRLVEVAGGWQFRSAPEHHRVVRGLFRERPYRLTRASVETLCIVAYKQPATRGDIEAIRGVDSGGVLETLVDRRLLRVAGRKDVAGRPLLYATTKDFLELFGLKNLRDMPTLVELGDDFERLAGESGFEAGPAEPQRVLPLDPEDEANLEAEREAAGLETEGGVADVAHASDGAVSEETAADAVANETERVPED